MLSRVVAAIVLVFGMATAGVGNAKVIDGGAAEVAALESVDDYVTRINELIESGGYSAALRVSGEGATRYAEDGEMRRQYGQMLMTVFDLRAARVELEAAARLLPELAEPHYSLALIAQLEGKDEEALTRVRQALVIAPEAEDATELLGELELSARIRRGEREEFEPGSPGVVPRQFMELLGKGQFKKAIDKHIHPDLIDAAMQRGGGGKGDRDKFIEGVVKGIRKELGEMGQGVDGFLLDRVDLNKDEAAVIGHWLETSKNDRDEVAMMLGMVDSPELSAHLDPDMVEVFRGLDAADRARLGDNMTGLVTTALQEITFDMRRHQGKWRITDISADMGGAKIGLSTFLDKMPAFFKAMGREMPTAEQGLAYRLGRIVGIALVIMVIATVIRRVVAKD